MVALQALRLSRDVYRRQRTRLPFLRTLGGDDSTYAHHMRDARFTIPTAGLLAKVVDLLANVPMEDRDTKAEPGGTQLPRPLQPDTLDQDLG